MPPKRKPAAKRARRRAESTSTRSESSDGSEGSSSASEDLRWAAYLIGDSGIAHAQAKVNKAFVLDFPVAIPGFSELGITPVQVASGSKHTLVLGSDGKVYGWGANHKGQLGLDPKTTPFTYSWVQVKQLNSKKVVKLACGAHHSLALTALGMVFAWGSNCHGQIAGPLSKEYRYEAFPAGVCLGQAISAGGNTSFAVDKNGDVFAWGNGKEGLCGLGEPPEGSIIDKPRKIPTFEEREEEVEDVASSPFHMIARSGKQLYACGNGEWGRLGTGNHYSQVFPTEVVFSEIKDETKPVISCSPDATYLLSKSGDVSVVRICGRAGPGTNESVMSLTQLNIPPISVSKVSGGKGYHMLSTEDGHLYTWGTSPACPQMGLFARDTDYNSKRTHPQLMTLLNGKHVSTFTCATGYAIAFVDLSKSSNPEMAIKVPVFGRKLDAGGAAQVQSPFETIRKAFLRSCEKNEPCENCSEASYDGPSREVVGASKLVEGDEVSVWMADVWAWGTIKSVLGNGKFAIKWQRTDWEDCDVDLHSDNEDVDCESDERWTYGFYEYWSESDSDEESDEEDDDDDDDQ